MLIIDKHDNRVTQRTLFDILEHIITDDIRNKLLSI